jgi:hypothetical protein
VSDDHTADVGISGVVNWVQIDLGTDDHDHLISPDEELARFGLTARQIGGCDRSPCAREGREGECGERLFGVP